MIEKVFPAIGSARVRRLARLLFQSRIAPTWPTTSCMHPMPSTLARRICRDCAADEQRHALLLENDAVLHTGFGEHVQRAGRRAKKARRESASVCAWSWLS